ncbi:hypothetical protein BZL30_1920 [Mycobacterium kansasii]|uniref:Uncharacterized protein n=1 Tax=Mycobacterium kansasii TaxID=1768 RepID=A0A1V3XQ81_MYCKA|nr:hypothetical protein BZL30_1920 [Mycobacterium kansasii]OOK80661.1 hypothetical protein BZL29_1961 [Mycobacterium kansasii]
MLVDRHRLYLLYAPVRVGSFGRPGPPLRGLVNSGRFRIESQPENV